jgi:hypothetical protein
MKPIVIALLSLSLAASSHATTVALGAGATSPNEVVVKVDGHETRLRLDGVKPSGDPAAATFLRCLVTSRVVRFQKTPAGTAKVTMLDGSVVSELVNEFLDTPTTIDPCSLGKAAYRPQEIHVAAASSTPQTKKRATTKQKPEAITDWVRHVSVASSPGKAPEPFRMPAAVTFPERQQQPIPGPPPAERPTISAPETVGTYTPGKASVDTMQSVPITNVKTGTMASPPQAAPSTPPTATPDTPPVTAQKPPEDSSV